MRGKKSLGNVGDVRGRGGVCGLMSGFKILGFYLKKTDLNSGKNCIFFLEKYIRFCTKIIVFVPKKKK